MGWGRWGVKRYAGELSSGRRNSDEFLLLLEFRFPQFLAKEKNYW
jgi:hypothetical protein